MSSKIEYKPESDVCPNCISELVYEHKRIGNHINWFVCKECGHREMASSNTISISKSSNYGK